MNREFSLSLSLSLLTARVRHSTQQCQQYVEEKTRRLDDERKSAGEGGTRRAKQRLPPIDFCALSRVKLPRAGSFMPRLPTSIFRYIRFVIELF